VKRYWVAPTLFVAACFGWVVWINIQIDRGLDQLERETELLQQEVQAWKDELRAASTSNGAP
jgi:hypothetical protein